ncbi:MAG: DNA primase [Lentimicrobiaceae bacterium]|nr:DNA primase [Lentimicrobiaceae bacterium]
MIKREVIEDILNTVRIEEVVGDFVRLTKRGVNHVGLCPFHDEKTPSFSVSSSKGIFKCFGCGVGGDAVNFVMKHENYSYAEALRYLAKKYNIEIVETEQTPDQIREMNERDALFAVSNFAKDFFVKSLHETEEGKSLGLTYFQERGFSKSTIEKFQLGYAPQDRESFTKTALQNGYTIDNLEKSGLTIVKENNYSFDRFQGRVIFPIQNFSGKVVGFGGRILSALKTATQAKYINSPETSIYHKSDVLYGLFPAKNAVKKEDKCLLVEGYTDVISLFQTGIENVVASSGTSLTMGQIKLIRKLTDNITIVYDGDSAGIKAALRGISLLLPENINVRVVLLPENEDPDSFARNHTKEDCLAYIREHEESFIQFKAKLLLKDIGNDPIKKAAVINQIAGDIALIKDLMMRSMFIKECSVLLGVSEENLVQTVSRLQTKSYFDERTKQNQQAEQATAEEKAAFVETVTEKTTSFLPPQRTKKVDIERALLRLLVNFGEEMVWIRTEEEENPVEIRLDQFIFNDLHEEGLHFENNLYRHFFETYADIAETHTHGVIPVLRQHPTDAVRNLCIDLIEMPKEESPLWESKIKNYIRSIYNDSGKLLEAAIRILQMLRLEKIRSLREDKAERLRTIADEDAKDLLFWEIKLLTDKIVEIESVLGTAFREKL